ncbi:hypothetical protein [Dactylosporangium sp. CA-139066]|uniref:hypothetical protein n=1 Tax=Dactylosporangium sp. CA-139066 TaxID=3239930 RepID=UPI003D904EDE
MIYLLLSLREFAEKVWASTDRQERRRALSPRRGAGLTGLVAATKKKRLPHVEKNHTPLIRYGEAGPGQ